MYKKHPRKYLAILLLLVVYSITSHAKQPVALKDTISNWQVYNGGKLLQAYNIHSSNKTIILLKGKIRAIDTLTVQYYDCSRCLNCKSCLSIKTDKDLLIRKMDPEEGTSEFNIKTTDLQVMALKNNSPTLLFYYKKDNSDKEILLFEIMIR